jgi:hypothetical protein
MKIMSNLAGVQNQLFPSDQTIKIVVGKLVHQYKDPLRQSAVLIAQLLRTLIEKASRQVSYMHDAKIRVTENLDLEVLQR